MSPKVPDKSQSDKFKDLAREVGADEDEQAFDAKLRKVLAHTPATESKKDDR
jgi:hypothetical protein